MTAATCTAAAAEAPQQPFRTRLCFHCGEPGHRAKECPSRADDAKDGTGTGGAQTKAGREAFARYLQCRRELAAEREKKRGQESEDDRADTTFVNAKARGPLHHFHRVLEWMNDKSAAATLAGEAAQPRDPMAVLQDEALEAAASSLNTTQRWNDLHKARWNDVDKAHREVFDGYIQDIRVRLASSLDVTPEDEAASTWHEKLSEAVNLGRPADFSSKSGGELGVYTVEKLQARCRQMHHLNFDNCDISAKLRSLLLPSHLPDGSNSSGDDRARPINAVSLGGGPGYDHVALCIGANFLHRAQPNSREFEVRHVQTQVFDLFDKDWKPVMSTLEECENQTFLAETAKDSTDRSNKRRSGSKMSMHHCDIRKGLDDVCHADLANAIESADVICVSFVLHENASFILDEGHDFHGEDDFSSEAILAGAMRDVFEQSPLGTIMVVMDSSNTLFPALKNTAKKHGWVFRGDDERRVEGQKIDNLGPKSFVLLERI